MALIKVDFFSTSLLRTVTINAVIPVDKSDLYGNYIGSYEPLKTLYLLHGIFGNYTDWISGTRIQRWAQDRNLAVIMPSGDNHFYVDCEVTGEKYGEFIGKELVEFTRRLFHLSNKRADTFIAGLSMGGYGAVRNGLKYNDVFGRVASLSGGLAFDRFAHLAEDAPIATSRKSYFQVVFGDFDKYSGSDNDIRALVLKCKKENKEIPLLYLCCGEQDHLLEANRAFYHFLQEQEVPVVYEEGPGAHEWDFWDRYIRRVLDWLPLEDSRQGMSSGNIGRGNKKQES